MHCSSTMLIHSFWSIFNYVFLQHINYCDFDSLVNRQHQSFLAQARGLIFQVVELMKWNKIFLNSISIYSWSSWEGFLEFENVRIWGQICRERFKKRPWDLWRCRTDLLPRIKELYDISRIKKISSFCLSLFTWIAG